MPEQGFDQGGKKKSRHKMPDAMERHQDRNIMISRKAQGASTHNVPAAPSVSPHCSKHACSEQFMVNLRIRASGINVLGLTQEMDISGKDMPDENGTQDCVDLVLNVLDLGQLTADYHRQPPRHGCMQQR